MYVACVKPDKLLVPKTAEALSYYYLFAFSPVILPLVYLPPPPIFSLCTTSNCTERRNVSKIFSSRVSTSTRFNLSVAASSTPLAFFAINNGDLVIHGLKRLVVLSRNANLHNSHTLSHPSTGWP